MTAQLCAHAGARIVSIEEVNRVPAPPPTETWFPIRHGDVIRAVTGSLSDAGFWVTEARYALSRGDHRLFATLSLSAALAEGVSLAVGVRNSTDKSLPMGFCGGSRVFVCDNLAFSSEILVRRKHTRHGREDFSANIREAVASLSQFREQEAAFVRRLHSTGADTPAGCELILRALNDGVISTRLVPEVYKEWTEPSHDVFRDRSAWSLYNAFTAAILPRSKSNPSEHADQTMRLSGLFTDYFRLAV